MKNITHSRDHQIRLQPRSRRNSENDCCRLSWQRLLQAEESLTWWYQRSQSLGRDRQCILQLQWKESLLMLWWTQVHQQHSFLGITPSLPTEGADRCSVDSVELRKVQRPRHHSEELWGTHTRLHCQTELTLSRGGRKLTSYGTREKGCS